MKSVFVSLSFVLCLLALTATSANAQEALKPRPSPLSLATMKYEDTYVKITYNRPHKKGRDIFGSLVPYGQVWRLGANEATEITVTKAIKLGGQTLNPGTYTLFAIPNPDKWTFLVNTDLEQWGAYRHNADHDILSFDVATGKTSETYEPFTIEFEQKNVQKTNLLFKWDDTQVAVPIEF